MEQTQSQNTTTLRDYARVLFRHKAVIITCFITVMATVFIGLKLKTPLYEARVKMLISAEKQVESPYYRDIIGMRQIDIALTQSEIVKSNPVIERAVMAMKLYEQPLNYEKRYCSSLKARLVDRSTKKLAEKLSQYTNEQQTAILFRSAVERLRKSIKVEPIRDTSLFTISAKDYSPVGAAIIANVVSRSYVIFDLEQQLAELQLKYGDKHLAVKQLRDTIEEMKKGLTAGPVSDIEAIGPASVKIMEQAQIPLEQAGPPEFVTFILALFMAPFLGVMLAFVFEYMDQTFKSPLDMERYLDFPYLGSIPRKKLRDKVVSPDFKSNSAYVKAFRSLSDQVFLLIKNKNIRSILFTSSLAREGTTAVVANIGRYLANKLGHKVLVIDANLRGSNMHKLLKLSDDKGLSDILAGEAGFNECIRTLDDGLSVITSGNSGFNPMTLLDTPRMASMMKEAREKYDVILIDSAYLKDFQDAIMTSDYTDGVVLVIDEGRARRQVVSSAIKPLENKGANMLGAVLNNRTYAIPRLIYEWI